MYQVKLTSWAQRQLDKLPSQNFERIVAALRRLGSEPRPPGAQKLKGFIYRLRVGDWRIIYAGFNRENLVIVGKIAGAAKILIIE